MNPSTASASTIDAGSVSDGRTAMESIPAGTRRGSTRSRTMDGSVPSPAKARKCEETFERRERPVGALRQDLKDPPERGPRRSRAGEADCVDPIIDDELYAVDPVPSDDDAPT